MLVSQFKYFIFFQMDIYETFCLAFLVLLLSIPKSFLCLVASFGQKNYDIIKIFSC